MTFGDRLNKLRKDRGVSVRELARRLGDVTPNTVGRWIDGEIQPRLDEAAKVAEFFAVSLCSMVEDGHVEELSSPELTRDEYLVLETFHSLGIDRREAIRRLHGPVSKPGEPARAPRPPQEGQEVTDPDRPPKSKPKTG